MEIRVNPKHVNRVNAAAKKSTYMTGITVTADPVVETAVMIVSQNGRQIEWWRGLDPVLSYLQYGYVRVTKACPFRHRKCIGERCSLFVVKNNVGDCAHVWSALRN